jgi:hypothetical protein
MKCKKCGHHARDINGMRKHYLKAHPGAMKHKGPRVRGMKVSLRQPGDRYCPTCGRLL